MRDLRAVLVKSGGPCRHEPPDSSAIDGSLPSRARGKGTGALRDEVGKLLGTGAPGAGGESGGSEELSGSPGFCSSPGCKDTAWAPLWDGEWVN